MLDFEVESVDRDAVVSADGIYRYALTRQFATAPEPYLLRDLTFVMLNPSTADNTVDDPTIRRCIGFARREGADRLVVVNLYAFRSPSPAVMREAADPVGPLNDDHLRGVFHGASANAERVVAAWGAGADPSRVDEVLGIAEDAGLSFVCLGTTKDGSPRHPLYVRGDAPLRWWAR